MRQSSFDWGNYQGIPGPRSDTLKNSDRNPTKYTQCYRHFEIDTELYLSKNFGIDFI